MSHLVSLYGGNSNLSPRQREEMSEEEVQRRIFGSKMFMVGWFSYSGAMWMLKLCMVFFFARITYAPLVSMSAIFQVELIRLQSRIKKAGLDHGSLRCRRHVLFYHLSCVVLDLSVRWPSLALHRAFYMIITNSDGGARPWHKLWQIYPDPGRAFITHSLRLRTPAQLTD